jgi:hypothetical protein
MTTVALVTCKRRRCEREVSPDRLELGAVYCSQRCRTWHYNSRNPSGPYARFVRATDPKRRLTVGETEAAQRAAKKLIEAGMAAYVNAKGYVRDLGAPVHPELAGRVFRKRRK